LLDAERFIPLIDVSSAPFPAFSRQIYLVARTAELGDLPDHLAEDCRQLVESQVISRLVDILPHMAGSIEVISG
ncbi:hypothetical protein, partial [Lutibacter sp.]|uniref:hypothetical protein n=1 Tax=Lutibacter sp. TaxID=1925666 RepID=UPI0025C4B7D3